MSKKSTNQLLILVLIILTFSTYLYLGLQHSNRINTRFDSNNWGDQLYHVETIKKISSEKRLYLGDRNRMPLYDYLQALFYTEGMSDEILFSQGKFINILLSIALIFVIRFINSKYLTNLNNLTFTLIIAFTFFLPKAAYLQPEILYYTLSYLVFIFFLKILRKNRLKDVFFCGILIALAYLTKATMLLGFLIFIFFQTANLLIQSIIVISKKHPPKMLKNQKVKMLKVLSTILLSTLIFIGFLSFYLIENRKTYGEYFFNSGTNIYLWYDSWPEVLQASKDGIDKPEIWNMIPKNQKPSLINYLKGHSFAEMTMRTVQGTAFNLWMLTTTYSSIPFTFALFCLISLTYMFLSNKCVRKEIINTTKESLLASTFVICYFTLHILAFSWYWFVGSGSRFILSLYLPYLFLIFYLFDKQKNIKKKGSKLFYLISISFLVIYTITITIPILYNFWCGH